MDAKTLIETLQQDWINNGGYVPPLLGCDLQDIELMKSKQRVIQLPELYRQFMLAFGRSSGGLRHGGEFTFPDVLSFKDEWQQMLPSDDCFVFMTNHDAFALFFHVNKQSDPVVYRIDEASPDAEPGLDIDELETLSKFLTNWIESEVEVNQKWKK